MKIKLLVDEAPIERKLICLLYTHIKWLNYNKGFNPKIINTEKKLYANRASQLYNWVTRKLISRYANKIKHVKLTFILFIYKTQVVFLAVRHLLLKHIVCIPTKYVIFISAYPSFVIYIRKYFFFHHFAGNCYSIKKNHKSFEYLLLFLFI